MKGLGATGVVDSKALSGRATNEVDGSAEGLLSVESTKTFGSKPDFHS